MNTEPAIKQLEGLGSEIIRLAQCARAHASVARERPDEYVAAAENHFLQLLPLVADARKAAVAAEAARTLTCVYCGHEYPQATPAWGDKALTDHIAKCEKHPMRSVIEDRDRLRRALVGLVGSSDPGRLREMEAAMRTLPAPDADKAAMVNAIHALLAEAEREGEDRG